MLERAGYRSNRAFGHGTLAGQSFGFEMPWTETYPIDDQCLASDVCTRITCEEYCRSHEVLWYSPSTSWNPIETVLGESWILTGDGVTVGSAIPLHFHS